MSPAVAGVLALTICLDVAGQFLFKTGLERSGDREARSLAARVAGSAPVAGGVLVYAAEFVAWLFVLSHADLSVAFPLATLSYVGVVLVSRFLLGEVVPPRRWIATLLIAAGAALVGASA